jgi:hypothetical protein
MVSKSLSLIFLAVFAISVAIAQNIDKADFSKR